MESRKKGKGQRKYFEDPEGAKREGTCRFVLWEEKEVFLLLEAM